MSDDDLLLLLGRRVRQRREERGLTLADLAARAGLSRRYLTEVEAGRTNVSLLKLAHVAHALRTPLGRLCDLPAPSGPARRVALVGLRGAGKSTVGKLLALELEVPFVELDRRIEEESGLDLEQIFSLHGEPFYRRLEAEALESWLGRSGRGVLATGGSIVTHADTWARLAATCFVVWLRAEPADHWKRVIDQGDTRPMAANPRAMDELRSLLAARAPLYARADLTIDTGSLPPERVVALIAAALGDSS